MAEGDGLHTGSGAAAFKGKTVEGEAGKKKCIRRVWRECEQLKRGGNKCYILFLKINFSLLVLLILVLMS